MFYGLKNPYVKILCLYNLYVFVKEQIGGVSQNYTRLSQMLIFLSWVVALRYTCDLYRQVSELHYSR